MFFVSILYFIQDLIMKTGSKTHEEVEEFNRVKNSIVSKIKSLSIEAGYKSYEVFA